MENKFKPRDRDELIALLEKSTPVDRIDVGRVTDLHELGEFFVKYYNYGANLDGIEDWDVSGAVDVSFMFYGCKAFDRPIGKWKLPRVRRLKFMFGGCEAFSQDISMLDLPGCDEDTEPVNLFGHPTLPTFFCHAGDPRGKSFEPRDKGELIGLLEKSTPVNRIKTRNLTDLSGLGQYFAKYYDGGRNLYGIRGWETSQVTSMDGLFEGCVNFNEPVGQWKVGSVRSMRGLFSGCREFNQDLSCWSVNGVEDFSSMFEGCESFNRPLARWRVDSAKDMSRMFYGCKSLNQDFSRWLVPHECDRGFMFEGCQPGQDLWGAGMPCRGDAATGFRPRNRRELIWLLKRSTPVRSIDVGAVTDLSNLGPLFATYYNDGANLAGIEDWDVSRATDMNHMFVGCRFLNQPIGSWKVDGVMDMRMMFCCCFWFRQDLSSWRIRSDCRTFGMFGSTEVVARPQGGNPAEFPF